jgi:Plasmid pRiA4b ORF-3-like protein
MGRGVSSLLGQPRRKSDRCPTAGDRTADYPRFVDGARRAPPEDVGGIPGFEAFAEAMTRQRHPERKRLTTWYGRAFDPTDIDVPAINTRISKLARRRALGKVGYAKSKGSIN